MISVCITTFNSAKYIEEQILSIIPQLSEDDEIIVSDDGSVDNTIEILEQLHCPLIHIYKNMGEHGYTPNFENALRKAHGDSIFLSDHDDIWLPNKVEVCMNYMKKYAMVVSDADIINEKGDTTGVSFFAIRHPYKSVFGNIIKFGYLGCCMAFRREVLIKALPFPPDHKLCTHDNWLFLVAQIFYSSIIIEDRLIHYRRHGDNTSSGGLSPTTSLGFKISYRLYLIRNLIARAHIS